MNTPSLAPASHDVVGVTRVWIERAVIGLGLCPFAKTVYIKEQVRYAVSEATNPGALLQDLRRELQDLARAAPEVVDTTLLIHPLALTGFLDFNDFIAVADDAIRTLGLTGVLQIAGFHPKYQFAGTASDDVTNCTNRSPYPTLQLLREASMSRAIAAFPEAGEIYRKNIETMRRLGRAGWTALDCAAPTGRRRRDA